MATKKNAHQKALHQIYASDGRAHGNKIRNLLRHLKKHPTDLQADRALDAPMKDKKASRSPMFKGAQDRVAATHVAFTKRIETMSEYTPKKDRVVTKRKVRAKKFSKTA